MKMKIKYVTIALIMTLFSLGVEAAAFKIDFSGMWALDKNRSEGLPPGMDQMMKVTQMGEKIDIEVKVTSPQGEQLVKDSYVVDGKEHEFNPPFIGGTPGGKGKRTSKLSTDNRGMEVKETAPVVGPNGEDELNISRRWQLSEDGNTLTIEMTTTGPNGVVKSKRIFVKK